MGPDSNVPDNYGAILIVTKTYKYIEKIYRECYYY